ncbi:MAG: zinc ribbon domain-containing protein [Actinomycetota bacterium]
MPIYEYECASCGERFEALIRSNKDKASCPKCKNTELKKLFSCFGFNSKEGEFSSTTGTSPCSSCSATSCNTCPSSK